MPRLRGILSRWPEQVHSDRFLFRVGHGEEGHAGSGQLEKFPAAADRSGTCGHYIVHYQEMPVAEIRILLATRVQGKALPDVFPAGQPVFACLAVGSLGFDYQVGPDLDFAGFVQARGNHHALVVSSLFLLCRVQGHWYDAVCFFQDRMPGKFLSAQAAEELSDFRPMVVFELVQELLRHSCLGESEQGCGSLQGKVGFHPCFQRVRFHGFVAGAS